MEKVIEINPELLTKLSNLAIRIEGKGQYNIVKYVRATLDALLKQSAFKLNYDNSEESILKDLNKVIEELEAMNFDQGVIRKLKAGYKNLAKNEISIINEFPEPMVCRRCGLITDATEKDHNTNCKVCGADLDTFVIHYPIYWMRQFDPLEALDFLKKTPLKYRNLLEGITPEKAEKKPPSGGWSLLEIIRHVKDANGVLNLRVKLILNHENPSLEFKKVWTRADKQPEKKETLVSILDEYIKSRNETAEILENIPLKEWWRPAIHEEFGSVKLKEQVSYFAAHELTHLRQIVNLKNKSN